MALTIAQYMGMTMTKNFIINKYLYMWLYLFEIALTILQCVDIYVWTVISSLELDDI